MNQERPQSTRLTDIPSSLAPLPVAIAVVIFGGIVLHFLGETFSLFITASFLAIIFMPIVEWLNKRRVPKIFSILLVLAIVGGVFFIMELLMQEIVTSTMEILPKYQTKWEDVFMPQLATAAGHISGSLRQQIMHLDVKKLISGDGIATAVLSVTSLVSNIALILLFMFFILASHPALRNKFDAAFSKPVAALLKQIFLGIDGKVRRYLITLILLNLLAAGAMMLVLTIFNVDLALLWSVLTFLLMFIPSVGSVIAMIIPIIVSFIQFEHPSEALLLSAILIVSQVIIGSVITPKIMGTSMNLSPLLILLSMVFWGWVWGLLGAILAVPITSTLFVIFENLESLKPLAVLMSSEPKKVISRRRGKPHTTNQHPGASV
ncbi:MAG TPA: AI-2E family transporter [Candidatus Kapabacteria bacterium]|nr:AI-2E family transporter [Candidatus Kapabacteria bacterium]